MLPGKSNWFVGFVSRAADVAAIGCFAFLWKMNNDVITLQNSDKNQQLQIDNTNKRSEEDHDKIIKFEAKLNEEDKVRKTISPL